jgi:hypothetical protein
MRDVKQTRYGIGSGNLDVNVRIGDSDKRAGIKGGHLLALPADMNASKVLKRPMPMQTSQQSSLAEINYKLYPVHSP